MRKQYLIVIMKVSCDELLAYIPFNTNNDEHFGICANFENNDEHVGICANFENNDEHFGICANFEPPKENMKAFISRLF